MKQHVTNKSCWSFHNIWWKVCLNRIFLSWIWFFKPRRYPASWAKHFPSTAQLAGSLLIKKKTYPWKKYLFQTNFLSNIMKKSTTFISDMLLHFSTLLTLLFKVEVNQKDQGLIQNDFEKSQNSSRE